MSFTVIPVETWNKVCPFEWFIITLLIHVPLSAAIKLVCLSYKFLHLDIPV